MHEQSKGSYHPLHPPDRGRPGPTRGPQSPTSLSCPLLWAPAGPDRHDRVTLLVLSRHFQKRRVLMEEDGPWRTPLGF